MGDKVPTGYFPPAKEGKAARLKVKSVTWPVPAALVGAVVVSVLVLAGWCLSP